MRDNLVHMSEGAHCACAALQARARYKIVSLNSLNNITPIRYTYLKLLPCYR